MPSIPEPADHSTDHSTNRAARRAARRSKADGSVSSPVQGGTGHRPLHAGHGKVGPTSPGRPGPRQYSARRGG